MIRRNKGHTEHVKGSRDEFMKAAPYDTWRLQMGQQLSSQCVWTNRAERAPCRRVAAAAEAQQPLAESLASCCLPQHEHLLPQRAQPDDRPAVGPLQAGADAGAQSLGFGASKP